MKAKMTLCSVLWCMLISISSGVVASFVMMKCMFHPASIRTLDVTGLVADFVSHQSHLKQSPEQLKEVSFQFSKALNEKMATMITSNDDIILPKEAVLAGGEDVTPLVRRALSSYLTKETNTRE